MAIMHCTFLSLQYKSTTPFPISCLPWESSAAAVLTGRQGYTFRGTASLCKIASTFALSCLRSTACGRESHSNRSAIHKQTFWPNNYTCVSLVPRLLPCSLGMRLTFDGKLSQCNTGVYIPKFCVDSISSFSFCLLCLMRNFWQDLMVPTAKSHCPCQARLFLTHLQIKWVRVSFIKSSAIDTLMWQTSHV